MHSVAHTSRIKMKPSSTHTIPNREIRPFQFSVIITKQTKESPLLPNRRTIMPMMMSMPALKLTMAASLSATPYKQLVFRHITTRKISSPKLSPSPFTSPSGCRIPPCALPVPSPSAHVSLQPRNSLSLSLPFSGFRYRSPKLYLSSRTGDTTTRSSTNKAEVTGSDPESPSDPGSGLVADMDHQDNAKAVNGGWYCDQTPSPSIQQHQPSNKILTLPTILTLGRVAAVPLLICSTFPVSCFL